MSGDEKGDHTIVHSCCDGANNTELNPRPRVLSIQSHVVSGYVGNKAAVLPLQVLGFDVDAINSVQFSNHTRYGLYRGQVLEGWELDELYSGLEDNDLVNYTHVLTGYVASESFLQKIGLLIAKVQEKCPEMLYLCDPVLGDNGRFYVPDTVIPIYRTEILPLAHVITPNTFELQALSDMPVTCEKEALAAMNVIHDIGVPIVVLTSLDGTPDLITYVSHLDKNTKERNIWKVSGSRLTEASLTGTGDLFSALFLAWFAKTRSIPRTLELVNSTMETVIRRTLAKKMVGAKAKCLELEIIGSLDIIMNPLSNSTIKREASKVNLH